MVLRCLLCKSRGAGKGGLRAVAGHRVSRGAVIGTLALKIKNFIFNKMQIESVRQRSNSCTLKFSSLPGTAWFHYSLAPVPLQSSPKMRKKKNKNHLNYLKNLSSALKFTTG